MALRAQPSTGTSLVSVKTSLSSYSANRPCMFMVTPGNSSFLSNGGGTLKVADPRLTYCDRLRCNGYGGGSLGTGLNLCARLGRILKACTDAILSNFEDPEKVLEQAILDMNNDLLKIHQATAVVMASQKQLEVKCNDAHSTSEYWYQKAQFALSQGQEGIAREALHQRKYFMDNESILTDQLHQLKIVVDSLVSKTHHLESEIREANLKKEGLQLRSAAAKTKIKVQEMVGTVGNTGSLSAFERMEEKVLFIESKADALDTFTDNIDEEFKTLQDLSVEDQLADLKIKQSTKPKMRELPPGRTSVPENTVSPA